MTTPKRFRKRPVTGHGEPVMYVEIPEIYDGVSVFVYEDGHMGNRWDREKFPKQWAATERYIAAAQPPNTKEEK